MKKRIGILLLCSALLIANLSGCASQAVPPSEKTPDDTTTADMIAENEPSASEDWLVSIVDGTLTADMTVDKKDDFFTAVNFDWLIEAEIPDGYAENSMIMERYIEVKSQMTELLNDEAQDSHEAVLVRTLYNQFCDMEKRNEAGISPLIPYIEQIQALETIEDIREYVAKSSNNLGEKLMTVEVAPDLNDSTAHALYIDPPGFSLGNADEYRTLTGMGERTRNINEEIFKELLVYMGMTQEQAQKINDDFFDFESDMAVVAMGTEAFSQPDYITKIYNPMSVDELMAMSPDYPIVEILSDYIDAGVDEIIIQDVRWLERINELFVDENTEKIKAYLIRMAVFGLYSYLDETCFDMYKRRVSEIYGIEPSDRIEDIAYDYCASEKSLLAMAAGKMYVDAYVSEKTKAEVTEIIGDVIAVYRERLSNNSWLSEQTRQNAIEKLDNMKVRVAYPDDWSVYDCSELEFSDYDDGGSLVENYMRLMDYSQRQSVIKAISPVDSRSWPAPPHMVNAGYSPSDNSINIFGGILGGGIYDSEAPIETKLGVIGMVIGHEVSHGFDSVGSQYDKDGNVSNWWTQDDLNAFKERVLKVSDYYELFEPLTGQFLNGELVKGEAVADLGGMSCVIEISRSIPDFDYKLFFESYARLWRKLQTEKSLESAILTDPHPPAYLRTNIVVQQFQEFYDAFDVKEGDGMYLPPEERLMVW